MNNKIIFHLDIDAFFANVEVSNNPKYKNKPVIVCGRTTNSVVSTANYEARKYGIKSAMPFFQAKKICPQGIFLTGNYDLYEQYSNKFIDLIKRNITNKIEKTSIDEAFIDATNLSSKNNYLTIANKIKKLIWDKLKITLSIGISWNKFLAKMATDFNKPNGITVISNKQDLQEKIWPLAINDMYFIGNKTAQQLIRNGIKTIGDLALSKNKIVLQKILKNKWYEFWLNANGYGNDIVDNSQKLPKSISLHHTLLQKTNNIQELEVIIKKIAKQLSKKLQIYNCKAKTIVLLVKINRFNFISKRMTVKGYIKNYEQIFYYANDLLIKFFEDQEVRFLGIELTNIIYVEQLQNERNLITIFNKKESDDVLLNKIVYTVNNKIGKNLLQIGFSKN